MRRTTTPDTVAVRSIKTRRRYRRDVGDLRPLAESMREVGLLHPVVVTPDAVLVAGARRLAAAKMLGWGRVPVTVVDLDEVVRGEHDENVHRKSFAPSEYVAITEALEAREREAAKERQGTRTDKHPAKFAESTRGETRAKLAKYAGVSHLTLKRAREVVEAAEAEPERYGDLVEEMDRTGRVYGAYTRLLVRRRAATIEAEPRPLPLGPFRVIVADPPWPYELRQADPSHRGACPYPSMTVDAIMALNVPEVAHDDCVLWLWTTNSHLPVSFDVIKAWGFEYKTLLTWAKDRAGVGNWLRGKTEHCLMAVRGRPTVRLTNQSTLLPAKRRGHSSKPEAFYEMVEKLCPGSRVELFQRRPREGWVGHGDEVNG